MWGLLSRWGGELGISLGSPQGIQTTLHLVRWKTSLHSRQCREIRPYFESGHLSVHSTWVSKLWVPHIPIDERSLLLRCMWKAGIPLESKPGNQLSSRDDLVFLELLSWTWCSSRHGTVFSGHLWSCLKSSHFSCLIWIAEWLWNQCGGNEPHLELIWGALVLLR